MAAPLEAAALLDASRLEAPRLLWEARLALFGGLSVGPSSAVGASGVVEDCEARLVERFLLRPPRALEDAAAALVPKRVDEAGPLGVAEFAAAAEAAALVAVVLGVREDEGCVVDSRAAASAAAWARVRTRGASLSVRAARPLPRVSIRDAHAL